MKKRLIQEEHHGFRFLRNGKLSQNFSKNFPPLPRDSSAYARIPESFIIFAFVSKLLKSVKPQKKQVFRGHEGATYIFENFVDSVSKRIEKRFGIYGPGKNIWDKVIESIAAEMVTTSSGWIPEKKVIEIVSNAYPQIKQEDLLGTFERNLINYKNPSVCR